jgi:hypothetical protein
MEELPGRITRPGSNGRTEEIRPAGPGKTSTYLAAALLGPVARTFSA